MSTATLTDNPMQPYSKEELLQMAETGRNKLQMDTSTRRKR